VDLFAFRTDEELVRRHLAAILGPGHCTELRMMKAQFHTGNLIVYSPANFRTLGGWYDHPDLFYCDAVRVRGVSAYLTVNPVKPETIDRSRNQIAVLDKDRRPGTSKTDILCYRWLYVDIDSIRSPSISATDGERDKALEVRDAILADYPVLAASAQHGMSGNGAWILVRLPDYPPDDLHQSLILRALHRLAREYKGLERTKLFRIL